MRFVSLFSGIGGFDLAFERAGMTCVAQVEIDPNARRVLSYHWPDVPKFEDVRRFNRRSIDGPVDLIAGGFPCQDVSVAGRRAGLAGERSGLWWQFRRIVREFKPRWVVVENVPGLLSSNAGRDFATIVRGLVRCGYGVAWRILDAQYFGVAQRRRRVFIVASLGSGSAAEVLFESVGVPGNPTPRRKTWEEIASTLGSSSPEGGRRTTDLDGAGAYVIGALTNRQPSSDASCASQGHVIAYPDPAYAVSGNGSRFGSGRENQDTFVFESRIARNGRGAPDNIVPPLKAESGKSGKGDSAPLIAFSSKDYGADASEDIAPTLRSMNFDESHINGGGQVAVAFDWQAGGSANDNSFRGKARSYIVRKGEYAQMRANARDAVQISAGVRRLTPRECERLQGFLDDWTSICSDSVRYRQLSNAVAVPVVEWIGCRIVNLDVR